MRALQSWQALLQSWPNNVWFFYIWWSQGSNWSKSGKAKSAPLQFTQLSGMTDSKVIQLFWLPNAITLVSHSRPVLLPARHKADKVGGGKADGCPCLIGWDPCCFCRWESAALFSSISNNQCHSLSFSLSCWRKQLWLSKRPREVKMHAIELDQILTVAFDTMEAVEDLDDIIWSQDAAVAMNLSQNIRTSSWTCLNVFKTMQMNAVYLLWQWPVLNQQQKA